MGKRASHVHVIARRHIASIFESNSREMRRRMSDSHMAARSRPTKDGMLRFTAPMSGIEQYISMSRPPVSETLEGPGERWIQDVMRSLFLFHEDDAVSCGPLSGSVESWEGREEGRSHRHSQRPHLGSLPGRCPRWRRRLQRNSEDIPRPIEDIPGAIETQAAPVPLPEAPDDPVDSGVATSSRPPRRRRQRHSL